MPSSYHGRHMPLPRLEPGTSGKRWVSVANWATLVGYNNSNVTTRLHLKTQRKQETYYYYVKKKSKSRKY
ncbi:hypothetical protein Hanom_Chr08g00698061 [Helianthus anomalus]